MKEWTMIVEVDGRQVAEFPPEKRKKPELGEEVVINQGGIPEGQLRDGRYKVVLVNSFGCRFVVAPIIPKCSRPVC